MRFVSTFPSQVIAYSYSQKEKTISNCSLMTYIAAVIFLISIPITIFLLLALVSAEVGENVSLGEFFSALGQVPGLQALLCAGIHMQVIFAIVAVYLGMRIRTDSASAPALTLAFGVISLVMSFVLFGGLVAAIGGILMIIGGAMAMNAQRNALSSIHHLT